MDKKVLKAIRRDCHGTMWPCYIMNGLSTLLSFLIPTLAAWLVGDMTDSLLSLDIPAINSRLLPFFAAIALEALFLPLIQMLGSLMLVRQGGSYQTLLMRRILRRPLSALYKDTGATVAEHVMEHAPYYYFIQISKCTLPVTAAIYCAALFYILFFGGIPAFFAVAVLLLAGLPLVRTAVLGKLTAKITARERDYETERAREEEAMFMARCFYMSNGLAEPCIKGFRARFEKRYQNIGRKKHFLEAVRTVFDYICDYGASLGVLFIGSIPVLTGRMGVGALMTGYLLLPTLTSFYSKISEQIEDIQKEKDMQSRLTVFYGENAADLADTESDMPSSVQGVYEIRLEHVTFTYPASELPVLKDWCGSFFLGEKIGLLGENGSGKSTLVHLISGLYTPQAGSVKDGNGNRLSKEMLRRLVTIQEQDGFIFQGTVWDNLFADENLKEEAHRLLSELGFEKPLDYEVAANAGNLSPGEQHKLLCARALLRDSEFLILDEPFNHLDNRGAAALLRRIEASKKGIILISHHNAFSADLLDRTVLIVRK